MRPYQFILTLLTLVGQFFNVASVIPNNEQILQESITNQLVEQIGPYREEVLAWARGIISSEPIQTRAEYLTCDVCVPMLNIIRPILSLPIIPIDEIVIRAIVVFCQIADLAPDPSICNATIRNFADPVIYIAESKSYDELSNDDFCGIINPNCRPVRPQFTNWTIDIDENKPEVEDQPQLPAGEKGVKILQFTDIHLDLDYAVGSPTTCNLPICCRNDTAEDPGDEERAGPFGHYKCALPEQALEAIFDHAVENHGDVQFIFLTGDYIHSGVWLYNELENSRHIERVTRLLREKFPQVPVIALTGNHEAAPCNLYPPPNIWEEGDGRFNLSWMYDVTVDPFLDIFEQYPAQLEQFRRDGFYTAKVSADSKLRFVVLNTNICYVNNFWLPWNPVDPSGQLQWFANTMLEAENANEKVLILAHISPGSGSCWEVWSDKFDKIVNRFENTIMGQFYGHSHTDSFSIAFERGTERPTSTLYISPSMLTDGMNSGYKVYYIDGNRGSESTWELINTESWILDTIESNKAGDARFSKLYSAREDFGLESLRPDAWYNFVKRMISDNELFRKFERFMYKNTASTTKYTPCQREQVETDCIVRRLCGLVRAYSGDNSHCTEIKRLMDEYLREKNKSNGYKFGSKIVNIAMITFIGKLLLLAAL